MAGGGMEAAMAKNTSGFPTDEGMEVIIHRVELRVPAGSTAVLVKNLYLSCDPWMHGRMSKHNEGATVPARDFVIGEVGLGQFHRRGKVIDSTHPEFNAGNHVWGMSAWEEYTVVTQPELIPFQDQAHRAAALLLYRCS
uniref:Oxidoreductase N-terminal domain-containing protein n=1 Tax=Setaria viridis TaxID=4556 RepID=A0A4V6D655_SETVI|nr:hypothetical protein SEVIR_8G077400v2 [Setaria viridis]